MLLPTCLVPDKIEAYFGVNLVSQIGGFGEALGPYMCMYAWFTH